jgi:hypothetical protein
MVRKLMGTLPYVAGTNLVLLEPDVAAAFPNGPSAQNPNIVLIKSSYFLTNFFVYYGRQIQVKLLADPYLMRALSREDTFTRVKVSSFSIHVHKIYTIRWYTADKR